MVGLFVYLDRQMQPGQWSDAGMFIQTLMLAATARGLATCAQAFRWVRQCSMAHAKAM